MWICGCNGFDHALCRNPRRALEMLERARRLSPRDPTMFLWLPGGAIAHFLAGRMEQAIQWTEDALRLNPRHMISLFLRTAAEVAAGQTDAGRRTVERMRAVNPTATVPGATVKGRSGSFAMVRHPSANDRYWRSVRPEST